MQLKDATILIADDEADLLEYFASWFKREGCRVLTAENGKEALELARTNQVDVLISDIRMPVMDGIELARKIRENIPYVPKLLFVSGFSDLEDRETLNLGVEARLPKPLRRIELVSAARDCLTDRNSLWERPSSVMPRRKLEMTFESVAAAERDGLIAFGRGGFCLNSKVVADVDQEIGLALGFTADRQTMIGHGSVRWIAQGEAKIGVQINHLEGQSCAWFANLAEKTEAGAFIPRDCIAAKLTG
jgi:CheY-like chemotaxis protein